MGGYKRNTLNDLSCQTHCHLSTKEKLSVSWQFFETYGVINDCSGWRNEVINQCLEFGTSALQNSTLSTDASAVMLSLTQAGTTATQFNRSYHRIYAACCRWTRLIYSEIYSQNEHNTLPRIWTWSLLGYTKSCTVTDLKKICAIRSALFFFFFCAIHIWTKISQWKCSIKISLDERLLV